MKKLLLLMSLFIVLSCSKNEDDEPLCETNKTGTVILENDAGYSLTVRVKGKIVATIANNKTTTLPNHPIGETLFVAVGDGNASIDKKITLAACKTVTVVFK